MYRVYEVRARIGDSLELDRAISFYTEDDSSIKGITDEQFHEAARELLNGFVQNETRSTYNNYPQSFKRQGERVYVQKLPEYPEVMIYESSHGLGMKPDNGREIQPRGRI